jgi:hypothetical protein
MQPERERERAEPSAYPTPITLFDQMQSRLPSELSNILHNQTRSTSSSSSSTAAIQSRTRRHHPAQKFSPSTQTRRQRAAQAAEQRMHKNNPPVITQTKPESETKQNTSPLNATIPAASIQPAIETNDTPIQPVSLMEIPSAPTAPLERTVGNTYRNPNITKQRLMERKRREAEKKHQSEEDEAMLLAFGPRSEDDDNDFHDALEEHSPNDPEFFDAVPMLFQQLSEELDTHAKEIDKQRKNSMDNNQLEETQKLLVAARNVIQPLTQGQPDQETAGHIVTNAANIAAEAVADINTEDNVGHTASTMVVDAMTAAAGTAARFSKKSTPTDYGVAVAIEAGVDTECALHVPPCSNTGSAKKTKTLRLKQVCSNINPKEIATAAVETAKQKIEKLQKLADILNTAINDTSGKVTDAAKLNLQRTKHILDGAINKLKQLLDSYILPTLGSLAGTTANAAATAATAAATAAAATANVAATAAATATAATANAAATAATAAAELLNTIGGEIVFQLRQLLPIIQDNLPQVRDLILNTFELLGQVILFCGGVIVKLSGITAGAIIQYVPQLVEGTLNMGMAAVQGAVHGAQAVGNATVRGVQTYGPIVVDGTQRVGSAVGTAAVRGAQAVGNAAVRGVQTYGPIVVDGTLAVGSATLYGVRTLTGAALQGVQALGSIAFYGIQTIVPPIFRGTITATSVILSLIAQLGSTVAGITAALVGGGRRPEVRLRMRQTGIDPIGAVFRPNVLGRLDIDMVGWDGGRKQIKVRKHHRKQTKVRRRRHKQPKHTQKYHPKRTRKYYPKHTRKYYPKHSFTRHNRRKKRT